MRAQLKENKIFSTKRECSRSLFTCHKQKQKMKTTTKLLPSNGSKNPSTTSMCMCTQHTTQSRAFLSSQQGEKKQKEEKKPECQLSIIKHLVNRFGLTFSVEIRILNCAGYKQQVSFAKKQNRKTTIISSKTLKYWKYKIKMSNKKGNNTSL